MQSQLNLFDESAFQRSPVTQDLIDWLAMVKEGEFTTYEELSVIAGFNVKTTKRHHLTSALKIAQTEHSAVFRCEPKRGYYRLTQREIDKHANTTHGNRLVRDTKRYRSKVECVDVRELKTQEERTEHGFALANIGLREAATRKPFQMEVKKVLARSPEQNIAWDSVMERLKTFG